MTRHSLREYQRFRVMNYGGGGGGGECLLLSLGRRQRATTRLRVIGAGDLWAHVSRQAAGGQPRVNDGDKVGVRAFACVRSTALHLPALARGGQPEDASAGHKHRQKRRERYPEQRQEKATSEAAEEHQTA
jgi:hypothetical protein